MKHTIYQAGPLFTEAERAWHYHFTARLQEAGHTVLWPGALLSPEEIAAAGADAVDLIFGVCRSAIDNCTCVVALLDGVQVDDGTAWEIGYAYAKGLPIYGIRTDSRVAGDTQHNLVNSMIEGSLWEVTNSMDGIVTLLGSTQD